MSTHYVVLLTFKWWKAHENTESFQFRDGPSQSPNWKNVVYLVAANQGDPNSPALQSVWPALRLRVEFPVVKLSMTVYIYIWVYHMSVFTYIIFLYTHIHLYTLIFKLSIYIYIYTYIYMHCAYIYILYISVNRTHIHCLNLFFVDHLDCGKTMCEAFRVTHHLEVTFIAAIPQVPIDIPQPLLSHNFSYFPENALFFLQINWNYYWDYIVRTTGTPTLSGVIVFQKTNKTLDTCQIVDVFACEKWWFCSFAIVMLDCQEFHTLNNIDG